MSTFHSGSRDLSDLPPSALAARLAQALSERKRGREERGQEPSPPQPTTQTGEGVSPDAQGIRTPDSGAASATACRDDRPEASPDVRRPEERTLNIRLDRLSSFRTEPPSGTRGERRDAPRGGQAPAPGTRSMEPAGAAAMAEDLRQARAEIARLRASEQQAQADLVQVRRRTERELLEMRQAAASDVITRMIPIVDDLERALEHLPEVMWGDPWVAGILMIGDRLRAMLTQQSVQRIEPQGERFDPHRHEAVARIPTADVPEDTITNVLLPGYILNGRVLRPAQVQVAARKDL